MESQSSIVQFVGYYFQDYFILLYYFLGGKLDTYVCEHLTSYINVVATFKLVSL